jgi:hypothetical protein
MACSYIFIFQFISVFTGYNVLTVVSLLWSSRSSLMFHRNICLHLQSQRVSQAKNQQEAGGQLAIGCMFHWNISFYQTTWHHISVDSTLCKCIHFWMNWSHKFIMYVLISYAEEYVFWLCFQCAFMYVNFKSKKVKIAVITWMFQNTDDEGTLQGHTKYV